VAIFIGIVVVGLVC